MDKVYLVTSGDYSDYGINAAFSTAELAQAYCDEMNTKDGTYTHTYKEYGVEIYDLDAPREQLSGCYECKVAMDGTVHSAKWCGWNRSTDGPYYYPHQGGYVLGYGSTPEHARRSAEQLRREKIALEGK